jgi:hypothetical protein
MTGGQTSLSLDAGSNDENDYDSTAIRRLAEDRQPLPIVMATDEECRHHEEKLTEIAQKSDGHCRPGCFFRAKTSVSVILQYVSIVPDDGFSRLNS